MVPGFESHGQVAMSTEKLIRLSQTGDMRHLEYGIYLNNSLIGF